MFADGDEFQRNVKSGKSLGIAYTDGVIDAIVAFRELKRLKNEKNNLKKTNVQKRQEYFPIKQCKPFGNVKILKVPLDELPHCDCDKTEAKPCGPSSNCVNVALKYECKFFMNFYAKFFGFFNVYLVSVFVIFIIKNIK